MEEKRIVLYVTLIQGRMNNGPVDALIQEMMQPNANKLKEEKKNILIIINEGSYER